MAQTLPWPNWLDDIWAKSPDTPGRSGETLARHTWLVLERLRDLAEVRPGLPEQLGEPRLWHRMFWAALFHDLGKVAPGFQDRLRGESNTSDAKRWGRHRHEVLSLAFVSWIYSPSVRGQPTPPAFGNDRRWAAAAVASHHRDAGEVFSLYPEAADDLLAQQFATISPNAIERIYRWIAECAPVWSARLGIPGVELVTLPPPAVATRLVSQEGATRTRGLLREYERWANEMEESAEPTTAELLLRGLLLQADRTASAHSKKLVAFSSSPDALLNRWSLAARYSHQDECAVTDGSAVLVAPTGSGKTEAALLWGARQAAGSGQLPRLFYALPYQASMNAMHRRLADTFGREQVGLQHGRSLLSLYRLAMETETSPAVAARQAKWRRNLARLNFFPVRVFSPYQMLKAMYRLKGYEAMLLDYYGGAFIFDEIHAYAPARLGLILSLIEHLRAEFNARFLVMSATFPALVRRHLAQALGSHSVIEASPEVYQGFRRHKIEMLDGDLLNNLHRIVTSAQLGLSVLVSCNTVQRAQDAWKALSELLPNTEFVLLHGRLNGRDRLAREEVVRDATGVSSGNRRPVVLVATQVVEVSLNIDLDTIFSDPAPLEALIQRFGRVNRRRSRTSLAAVHVFREPTDGQGIYDNHLVEAALDILDRADGRPLDEAEVGVWLDSIYSGDVEASWEGSFTKSLREGRMILRSLHPFQSDGTLADQFDAAFDSIEVLPAVLLPEYDQLATDDPILANSLVVPISDRRFRQLWKDGLIRRGTRPPVVEVPYYQEVGLDFSSLKGTGD